MAAASVRSVICTLQKRVSQIPIRMHLNFPQSCFFVSTSQHILSPRPPKKPLGAFIKFMKDKSAEIYNKRPGVRVTEVAKVAGEMWHDLDPEEKNKLNLDSRQAYQTYQEKYAMFLDGLNDTERTQLLQEQAAKKKARISRRLRMEQRKLGKPKMPANAYMLFVRSSRLERGNAHPTQFFKALTQYWKQIPQEEKNIYIEDARLEAEKYQQEMKKWEERMRKIGREDLIRKKSQKKARKSEQAVASKTKKKTVRTKKALKLETSASKPSVKSKTRTAKKRTVSKEVQTEE